MRTTFKGMKAQMEAAFKHPAQEAGGSSSSRSRTVPVPDGLEWLTVECSGGGDLVIAETDEAAVRMEGEGCVSTGREFHIDADGGNDLSVWIPKCVPCLCVEASGGGDVVCRLESMRGRSLVLEASGGCDISAYVGTIGGTTITGDASGGRDIVLRVPEDSAFDVTLNASSGGGFHTDLSLETSERTSSLLQGRHNDGGDSRIELSASGGGDVRLLKASPRDEA